MLLTHRAVVSGEAGQAEAAIAVDLVDTGGAVGAGG